MGQGTHMLERFAWIVKKPSRTTNAVLLICPVLVFLLIFYFFPVMRLFYSSFFDPEFTLKHYTHFFEKALYINILLRTLKIAMYVTVASLVVSYPLAYFLSEAKGKAKYLMLCIVLPLWTSLLVRNYAWMVLLQRNGIINKTLLDLEFISKPLHLMYNTGGVMVAMTHIMLPFMVLPIYSVLRGIDKDLKPAAYTLGANEVKAFLRITLPLSFPGIGAGAIFVFVMSLGFFITPALLGGPKVMMIATLIESQINFLNNWGFAAAIALVLLTASLLILGAFFKVVDFNRLSGKA